MLVQGGIVVAVEVDPRPHVGVQQRFEDVVDLVEQPRVVDDVYSVRSHREAGLEYKEKVI